MSGDWQTGDLAASIAGWDSSGTGGHFFSDGAGGFGSTAGGVNSGSSGGPSNFDIYNAIQNNGNVKYVQLDKNGNVQNLSSDVPPGMESITVDGSRWVPASGLLSNAIFGGSGGYDGTQFELSGLYSDAFGQHPANAQYQNIPSDAHFDDKGNLILKNGTVIHAGDEYVKYMQSQPYHNYVDQTTGGNLQPNTINANQENVANESTTNAGWGPVGNALSKFLLGYNPQTNGINPLTGLGYLLGPITSIPNMGLWAAGKQPSIDASTGKLTWGKPDDTHNPDGSLKQGVGPLPTFGGGTGGGTGTGTNYLNADFGSHSTPPGDIPFNPNVTGGNDGTGTVGGSGNIPLTINGVPINLDPNSLANLAATGGSPGNVQTGGGAPNDGSVPGGTTPSTDGTTTPPVTAAKPPFPAIQPYQPPPVRQADTSSPMYQAIAAMLSNRSSSPMIGNPFGALNPAYLSQTALGAGAPALGDGSLAMHGGRRPDESGGASQPPPVHMADGGQVGGMPQNQPQGPVPGWGGSMPWDYPGAGPQPMAQGPGPMGAPPAGMPPMGQPPRPMPQPAQGAMPQMMGQPPNPMPNPMAMPPTAPMPQQAPQQPMGTTPQGYAKGGLVQAAEAAKSAGRYGDDVLVHITPDEFHQFEAMHGPHSVNPKTGLPEFGWFGNLLKTLAPVIAEAIPGLGETVGNTLGVGKDIGSALTGAAIGGVANGGKGALYGGLTGLGGSLLSGPGSDFLQSLGLGPQTSGALMNAAIGAGGAAAAGGNPLEGAVINGALSYFAPQTNAKIKNAFAPKSLPTNVDGLSTTQLGDASSSPISGLTDGQLGTGAANAAKDSGSGALGGLFGGKTDMGTILPLLLLASAASGTSGPKVIQTPNLTKDPGMNYGTWLAGPYSGGLVPYDPTWAVDKTVNKAAGGPIGRGALAQMASPAAQMGAIRGPGDGKSDDVRAMLATGEHVIPAQDVSLIGNGDNDAGHARLEEMKQEVRRDGGQRDAKKPSPKQKKTPAQMMKKKVR